MRRTALGHFTDVCLSAAPSLRGWSLGLCQAAQPVFESGGAQGAFLLLTSTERERVHDGIEPLVFLGTGAGASWVEIGLPQLFGSLDRPSRELAFRSHRVKRLSHALRRTSMRGHAAWEAFAPARPYSDVISVDLTRRGFNQLCSLVPNRGAHEPLGDLRRLRRVLLRTLPARLSALTPDGSDAVIAPDGRVLHAPGLGRDGVSILSAAVRALERERLEARTASDGERLWDELLAGGWSVVEHVERDGKRVLLLSRGARDAALSPSQTALLGRVARGDTLKQIAIDLGLPKSTASECISAALSKLGFRSRGDYLRYTRRPND